MPVIPGFQGRSRFNMNVPVETATPASTLGDAFANVGGQATKIGLELMAFRKKAADARDVSEKSLQLQQELLETTTDLDNARMNDGSLNPEVFGFKDKEKQTRYSYTEKLGEFWNERLGAFSKTAASPESREDFLRRARGLREESILKGEAKTLELEVASTLNTQMELVKSIENQILVMPELSMAEVGNNASPAWSAMEDLRSKGLISEPQYKAIDNKISRGMAIATLDNFVRNSRPEDIQAFIFSGNLPQEYEEVLQQAQTISENGGIQQLRKMYKDQLSPEDMKAMEDRYRRIMTIPPEVRLKYRSRVGEEGTDPEQERMKQDLGKLAQSLSREDIEKYLRLSQNLNKSAALSSVQTDRREIEAYNRRAKDPTVKVKPEEKDFVLDRTFENIQNSPSFDEQFSGTKSVIEVAFADGIRRRREGLATESMEEAQAYIDGILSDPLADMKAVAKEIEKVVETTAAPDGALKSLDIVTGMIEEGKYIQQISEMRENNAKEHIQLRAKYRETLMSDPASLFADVPVGSERVARLDEAFENYQVAPYNRKYVSTAEVQDFKRQFTSANDEGKASTIAALRDRWGGLDNWFKVMNQYVDESGLPRAMGLAMMMPNTMAMESFISVVTRPQDIETDFKNKNPDLEAATFYEAVNSSEVFEQFNEAIAGMMPSTMEATGPLNDYRKALAQYSMHIYNKSNGAWYGDSSTEVAAKAAYQEIIGSNFVVASNGVSSVVAPIAPVVRAPMRAEGEFYPKQSELESFIDVYSDPKLMAGLAAIPEDFKDAYNKHFSSLAQPRPIQQMWEDTIQEKGYWATAPDLSGLILRFKEDSPYRGDALTQDGSPVIIPWQRLVNDPRLKAR